MKNCSRHKGCDDHHAHDAEHPAESPEAPVRADDIVDLLGAEVSTELTYQRDGYQPGEREPNRQSSGRAVSPTNFNQQPKQQRAYHRPDRATDNC